MPAEPQQGREYDGSLSVSACSPSRLDIPVPYGSRTSKGALITGANKKEVTQVQADAKTEYTLIYGLLLLRDSVTSFVKFRL